MIRETSGSMNEHQNLNNEQQEQRRKSDLDLDVEEKSMQSDREKVRYSSRPSVDDEYFIPSQPNTAHVGVRKYQNVLRSDSHTVAAAAAAAATDPQGPIQLMYPRSGDRIVLQSATYFSASLAKQ
jgi:hypothetical protein